TGVVRMPSVYGQGSRPAVIDMLLFVRAFEVIAGAGVYLEDVAGVDEEGDVDADAGLELCGLRAALCGGAAAPGVGLSDGGLDSSGQLNADGLVAVHEEIA